MSLHQDNDEGWLSLWYMKEFWQGACTIPIFNCSYEMSLATRYTSVYYHWVRCDWCHGLEVIAWPQQKRASLVGRALFSLIQRLPRHTGYSRVQYMGISMLSSRDKCMQYHLLQEKQWRYRTCAKLTTCINITMCRDRSSVDSWNLFLPEVEMIQKSLDDNHAHSLLSRANQEKVV